MVACKNCAPNFIQIYFPHGQLISGAGRPNKEYTLTMAGYNLWQNENLLTCADHLSGSERQKDRRQIHAMWNAAGVKPGDMDVPFMPEIYLDM